MEILTAIAAKSPFDAEKFEQLLRQRDKALDKALYLQEQLSGLTLYDYGDGAWTMLGWLIQTENIQAVKSVLRIAPEMLDQDSYRWEHWKLCPLALACHVGEDGEEMCMLLLENGAKVIDASFGGLNTKPEEYAAISLLKIGRKKKAVRTCEFAAWCLKSKGLGKDERKLILDQIRCNAYEEPIWDRLEEK
jgi:hypothetical protein